jgi:hypothetical protein
MLPAIHSLRWFRQALGVLLLFGLVSACAATSTQPTAGVTFIVPVPVEAFSPRTALQVSVWNAQRLKTLDQQAECVISRDVQTGTESIHCPEGVPYQKITPEEFVFPLQSINQRIQLTSQTVKTGEQYQIILRGLSSDDCNSTSATAEGTATTSTITLGELSWMTTEMACIQP